ncbi:metallophosphoesterase [Halobacillus halophilus]|uniref:metallophosphoesterase n=1 Tax=Halobacillus halophilus TaxID=1570 RepID=UPI001CD80E3D|nr:metallophosphoesterase [Halobacillus halophilus]MCA1011675.1 metallophosphoesterase [Halobacillus halophilus]
MGRKIKVASVVSGVFICLAAIGKVMYDTNVFKRKEVKITHKKIPEGSRFRILQMSDLHNKVFGRSNKKLLQTIEEAEADVVVITGDLIDRNTKQWTQVFSLIERIVGVYPHVFYVTGNHEWDHPLTHPFLEGLKERRVTVLRNEHRVLHLNDSLSINVVGIDDVNSNREKVEQAFEGMDPQFYTILLSHSPDFVNEYKDKPADLILSGHTHGGKVRIPFVGSLVAPGQGLLPDYDQGMYRTGFNQLLYVDRGLGTSVVHVRFFNQSQISLMEVTHKD